MNKKEVYRKGYNTGYDIANTNLQDYILAGASQDEFISDMLEIESEHFRQLSPFEFFAHNINECANSDVLWEAYEDGVHKGICTVAKHIHNNMCLNEV